MSEYQRIAFRAIDGPVSDANLKFMREQSSRAEITPWAFDNEYSFGDFHGDAYGMLRRGYDFHLHYANFGSRTLLIRLPNGLPDFAKPYIGPNALDFEKDRKGPGGILRIDPFFEPGEVDDLWDLDEMVERLLPIRAEILDGDLRPLYLAHIAVACDQNHCPEETVEAAVPAGLDSPTDAQRALAEYCGISKFMIQAAAQGVPTSPVRDDVESQHAEWLRNLALETKEKWLAECMSDSAAQVRRKMLAEFQASHPAFAWPTVVLNRAITELQATAKALASQAETRAKAADHRKKAKRLAEMATDPAPTLKKTEQLVQARSRASYESAAALLVELRQALSESGQPDLAERQANKLRNENPTLKMMISELRRAGFLAKS